MKRRILLCLISLTLLSLPWLGFPGYTLLAAFVPLFLLQDELEKTTNRNGKHPKIWPYVLVTFLLWTMATVWWVWNAIWFAAPASSMVITFVTFVPFMAYHYVRRRAKRELAYAVLISAWVGYEFIFLHGQITFPWLILGNAFANSVEAVQWYEYTGTLGGSVWVWACNIAIYEAIRAWRKRKTHRVWIRPAAWIGVPLLLSLILLWSYREKDDPITVQVIQPNFFSEDKFNGLSFAEQLRIILELSMQAPPEADYIVAPETAIDERIFEGQIDRDQYVNLMQSFLRQGYPGAAMVIGATTSRYYYAEDEMSSTAKKRVNEAGEFVIGWDNYNTALQIDTTRNVGIHHKSKLVAGAEMIPYGDVLPFLMKLSVDLGGTSGHYGTDPERSVFASRQGVSVGVPICWEAVFGEYTTDFVKKGAQALFIISNDSWWGETSGYKQLFAFSRLRAIETRRAIARSANTGISGFIDQRGRIVSRTRWNERVSQTGTIQLNDKTTFYVRFGDMTGRICLLVFALCVLYYIAYRRKKKDLLVR